MASFNDYLTVDGQRIFSLMAKGCKVTFTKVVLGDGIKDDSVSEVDIRNVINPVVTLNIDSVETSDDNKVTIRTLFQNTQGKPFYMREKGVYATIDGTEECLVFYANNGALAEYVDVAKTQLVEKVIQTVIMFSESDNINITLSSNEIADRVSDLEKEVETLKETTPITKGGTGANTARGAEYNIIGDMVQSTAEISDDTPIVVKRMTPNTTDGVTMWKKASLLWNYIKKKADSLYATLSHTHDDRYYTESEIDTKLNDYVEISTSLTLGENASTAYRGDRGKTAYEHSQAAHAPSNAEKNQNAFSKVIVGSTTITADTTTDSLTLVGSNVTITPDATNDKVTIGITKENVTNALGYTPPTSNTTYQEATQAASGLMSATDKKRLDSINNALGTVTGKTDSLEVSNSNILATSKAVNQLNNKLAGCWIEFTDADGNPTNEPYIHWYEEV